MLFWIIFLFVVCIALPFSTIMPSLSPAMGYALLYLAVALALAMLAGRVLWNATAPRRGRAAIRPPDPKRVAALDWPRSLSRGQMEAYCTAFLRQQGWTVTPGRSPLDDATFVTAARDGARLVLLCDLMGEELNPATIRSFAQAGPVFGNAQPVVVTLSAGRLPTPAEQAAKAAGVRLLRVAELPQLGSLAQPAPADAG